ncbi:MAG TPA: adenylate/guanylate cyclase domain-containing protein [Gammaproteobacteria bacterium]|nr:adenylate/guanylate cyclase domain-containing protein [Acidiferrobacter sp.]HAA36914.1 adenylate/guanylate cyclase domain-containing protein [Gammaproteobacteria bacterium]
MERKLSTILASDVVGFSKMMAANEEYTLRDLSRRRQVIDGVVAEHDGKIFGSAGDSIIAEFASPVNAARCAVEMQSRMASLNEDVPEELRMLFRVGINLGDVMVTEDNLFGDAVNIAARLEAAAHPEGICVSQSVFDMISQKIMVSFEDAGKLELKNIDHPVQAYFVIKGQGGVRYLQQAEAPQVAVEKAESGSLAIMLFKSLSTDEEQAYFCEGFSEDLIAALSRFRSLTVVSGNASFSYRDKQMSPKAIGKELGVRYILDGSVRKLGKKMRITTSLTNAQDESTVWSEKFDTTIDDIFDTQDEIIETIVATIAGKVEVNEAKRVSNARPENLTAYDMVLQGLEYHRRSNLTRSEASKALELFEKAIETDPTYARAYAWRACSLSNAAGWDPESYPENWFDICHASATRALELDPDDHEANRIMGAISLFLRDFDLARHHHDRAEELCPSDSYILGKNAEMRLYLGNPEEGLEKVTWAMRINPFCPDDLLEKDGKCRYWLEDFDGALASFKKMRTESRDGLFYSAATFKKLGREEEALDMLRRGIRLADVSIETFVESQPFQDQARNRELQEVLESIEST